MTQKTKDMKFEKVVEWDRYVYDPSLFIGIMFIGVYISFSLWDHNFLQSISLLVVGVWAVFINFLLNYIWHRKVYWRKSNDTR